MKKLTAVICLWGLLLCVQACSQNTSVKEVPQGEVFSTFEYKTPTGHWEKL